MLPLLIGILPILLLAATRRKGDIAPEAYLTWLGHPWLVGLLYLFFIGSVLMHGLYIWQAWPLRLLAHWQQPGDRNCHLAELAVGAHSRTHCDRNP
ncbi:MAG: hypothetical protein R2867_42900 [Caldilineaceae bacterium]